MFYIYLSSSGKTEYYYKKRPYLPILFQIHLQHNNLVPSTFSLYKVMSRRIKLFESLSRYDRSRVLSVLENQIADIIVVSYKGRETKAVWLKDDEQLTLVVLQDETASRIVTLLDTDEEDFLNLEDIYDDILGD